jgi:hypothetical protein
MNNANPQNGRDDGLAWRLRFVIDLATAAQVALWIGIIAYIAWHTNPRGDGTGWVAVAPATIILVLGVAPARNFRRRGPPLPGVLLACLGAAVSIAYFAEIVRETNMEWVPQTGYS